MNIASPADNKIVIKNTARRSYRRSVLALDHLIESNEKPATESAGTKDRITWEKCKYKCYRMSDCREENQKARLRKGRKGDLVKFVLEEARRIRPNS